MLKEYHNSKLDSSLVLTDKNILSDTRIESGRYYKILYNRSDLLTICVDGFLKEIKENQIVCLTPVQKVTIRENSSAFNLLMFNREFYCIHENDDEVSCNGVLFFGSTDVPVLTLDDAEQCKFHTLFSVFRDELNTVDEIQGEMLRMLLKRLIIKCTRLARKQYMSDNSAEYERDLIRNFNILVEKHFKEKRQVSDYAFMLNKSPKTLSNIFLTANNKSPLKVLHDRVLLEAKRYLLFSNMILKEIAYEIGFEDQSHFSRFFKKETGLSPSEFRNSHPESFSGKN